MAAQGNGGAGSAGGRALPQETTRKDKPMKRIFFALLGLLALAVAPVSGHAQTPGQSCKDAIVGTTRMADDKKSIIGCLLTDKGEQVWKSTIGGSSGDWQCVTADNSGIVDVQCVNVTDGRVCMKTGINANKWNCRDLSAWDNTDHGMGP